MCPKSTFGTDVKLGVVYRILYHLARDVVKTVMGSWDDLSDEEQEEIEYRIRERVRQLQNQGVV